MLKQLKKRSNITQSKLTNKAFTAKNTRGKAGGAIMEFSSWVYTSRE